MPAWRQPLIEVSLDGTARLDGVVTMCLDASRQTPVSTLSLSLANQRSAWPSEVKPGAKLVVRWGFDAGKLDTLFTGSVLRARVDDRLEIEALCTARALNETRIVRTYADENADAVVRHLLQGLPFTAQTLMPCETKIDMLPLQNHSIAQGLAWLNRRLKLDASWYADAKGGFHWDTRDETQAPSAVIEPDQILTLAPLPEGRLLATILGRTIWHSTTLTLTDSRRKTDTYYVEAVRHTAGRPDEAAGPRSQLWLAPLGAASKGEGGRGRLDTELKRLFTSLAPDLRHAFRLSVAGVVSRVYLDPADQSACYRADVHVGGDTDTGEGSLVLPKVRVAAPFAQKGYGFFCLPEPGAQVTVSFHDGDVTQPYIDGSLYPTGGAPESESGTAYAQGSLALHGKQHQDLHFEAEKQRVTLSCKRNGSEFAFGEDAGLRVRSRDAVELKSEKTAEGGAGTLALSAKGPMGETKLAMSESGAMLEASQNGAIELKAGAVTALKLNAAQAALNAPMVELGNTQLPMTIGLVDAKLLGTILTSILSSGMSPMGPVTFPALALLNVLDQTACSLTVKMRK